MANEKGSRAVPVTMGSPRFVTNEIERFRCTHAWFAPGTDLEPHNHDRATFGVILEGSFDLTFTNPAIRRRPLECRPATVFTEPAGETHGNRIGTGGASVVVIQIDPDAGDSMIEPLRPLLVDRINHFSSERITLRARRLAQELRRSDPLSRLAAESLALEMLVDAGRHDLRWTRSDAAPAWLNTAEDFIRAHFREPLRIADVAAAAGVHPAHLACVFRDAHHVPLATFIRRLRIEWAADRLAHSDDPIPSIAYAAGFADQSHLTRAFKTYSGETPGTFRTRIQGSGSARLAM
jgi:AraC family transcriptional regulator